MKEEKKIGRKEKLLPKELSPEEEPSSPFMDNCERCHCLITAGQGYCAKCTWEIEGENRRKHEKMSNL